MKKNLLNKKGGFTLIEVVIVLAIAGLIFVIVFLAVSAAQRSRRDNERQQSASRLIAAAEQVASANNGVLPANCTAIGTAYDDQGGSYPCTDVGTSPSASAQGNMEYGPNRSCNGAAFQTTSRVVAVRYWQESSGAVACKDDG